MTKQHAKICFCAALIFAVTHLAQAQGISQPRFDSGWSLYHSEGDITLTRDGRRTVYPDGSSIPTGILLGAKDMVQTSKGYAELRLVSAASYTEAVLRLSENTSLVISGVSGGAALELLYGRLVIQSDVPLTVKTGNSLCQLKECTAGIEYVSRPGFPPPALVIQCYKGEGELFVNHASETEAARFAIRNAESLSLEYRTPFYYIERKSLAISSGTPAEAAIFEELEDLHYFVPEQATFNDVSLAELAREPEYSQGVDHSKAFKMKTGTAIAALVLMGGGAAMQGYAHLGNPKPEVQRGLFYGGYGALGMGAAFLLISIVHRSPSR